MTNEQRIREAIAELENAPDIAAYLRQVGIWGTRKHPERCVLYDFLRVRGCMVVMVGYRQISFPNRNRHPADERTHLTVETPPRIADFMREFDDGRYPSLEDPTYPCWTPRGP